LAFALLSGLAAAVSGLRGPALELSGAEAELRCYAFDWDDNILFMPSKIHMERRGEPVALSTAEFAVQRHDKELKPPNGNFDLAFREFRDLDPSRNFFREDAVTALSQQKVGLAFGAWRRALVEAAPWAVITARGHNSSTLRSGAKEVIVRTLAAPGELAALERRIKERYNLGGLDEEGALDYYLERICDFYAVSGVDFQGRMQAWLTASHGEATKAAGDGLDLDPGKPEDGKKLALLHFTETQIGSARPATMGFSDDDGKNVRSVGAYMQASLSKDFPLVKFVLYSTETGSQEKVSTFARGDELTETRKRKRE